MASSVVTDPELLAKLNAPEPKTDSKGIVTDPALLAVLNGEAHPLVAAHADMAVDQGAPAAAPEQKGTLQTIREAIHAPTRALENSFFMGLGDRARALIDSSLSGGGYGQHLKDEQGDTEAFQNAHPIADAALGVVGGAASPIGVLGAVGKGAALASKLGIGELGAKALIGGGTGAAIGATQGALGSKDWTNLPQVAKDTGVGGLGGLVIGGAMPGAAKLIGAGYNAVANGVRGGVEGMSRGAGAHLIKAVEADGPAAVQQRVTELGPDAMLADAGPSLFGRLQGAIGGSLEGRAIATRALDARDAGTIQRIRDDVNNALGPYQNDDAQTVTNAINAHRTAVDSVNYPAALNNAPPVQIAHIVEQLNNQIPRSVGDEQKALTNLRDLLTTPAPKPQSAPVSVPTATPIKATAPADSLAADIAAIRAKYGDGAAALYEKQQQLAASKPQSAPVVAPTAAPGPVVAPTAAPTPVAAPSAAPTPVAAPIAAPGPARVPKSDAEILHKVKGEIDKVINYDAPGLGVPAGALQRQQGALKNMRFQLNDALEKQVPGYANANAVSAALAKRAEAVDAGTQLLAANKTSPSPGRFAAEFEPLQQGEKIAFAKGNRHNVERILGQNENDLVALKRNLQGEGGWNTANIATVHGQPAADELAGTVNRNTVFRNTRNEAIKGAQTDLRNAARKEMKPDPSTEIPLINPNTSATGLPLTILKKGAVAVLNALTKSDPTRRYGEVARALTEQGTARDARFAAIVDAINRRQSNATGAETAGKVGSVVAALLGKGTVDELRGGPRRKMHTP